MNNVVDFAIQKHAVLIGLPTVIWNIILSFLAFCDVLNLLYLHRNFCYIIDESMFKFYLITRIMFVWK